MSNTANDKKNTYEKTHWNIEGYYVVWNDVYIEYWAHSDKNETKRKPTYYICCTNIFDGTLCEISLTQDEGDCSSGWTTAAQTDFEIINSAFNSIDMVEYLYLLF